jgi:hypothetical protein
MPVPFAQYPTFLVAPSVRSVLSPSLRFTASSSESEESAEETFEDEDEEEKESENIGELRSSHPVTVGMTRTVPLGILLPRTTISSMTSISYIGVQTHHPFHILRQSCSNVKPHAPQLRDKAY